jgi:hypothetical protein
MAGGPIPSQKALFGKRNKVHTYRVDHQWNNIKGILCTDPLFIFTRYIIIWHHWRSAHNIFTHMQKHVRNASCMKEKTLYYFKPH